MGKVVDVNMLEQYRLDMQRYGLYISRARALPEYRDGLKPVQRKILYSMFHDVKAISHTVKCAAIVGNTIGKYHPHGDSSTYDTIKPMTNWFETGVPLIDQQGNFGNVAGEKQAAMRYTEASLSKFAVDCVIGELAETSKVVDWSPNYDNKYEEPDYFPAKVPLLLINGSFGIVMGFRVYIPRHNIDEVIDATLTLIDNPDAQITLIPDCSMPCEIIDTNWAEISNKGRGNYKVRGIIEEGEHHGCPMLIIRSLPDQVFMNTVKDEIEDLIAKKKLVQIHDMYDETVANKLKFVIILKKGADPKYVKEVIYKSTQMTKTFSVNFEVLDGINPTRMSYTSYLENFIRFRLYTKFRYYCNKIQQIRTKAHERELYIRVLKSGEIDNIIKLIRKQKTIDENYIVEYLIKKLHVTDIQAKFIINTNIGKLSMAYLHKYEEEAAAMNAEVVRLTKFTLDDELILQDIKQELIVYKQLYGAKRQSKVIKEIRSDIPAGEFKIVVTENNFIRKIQPSDPIDNRNSAAPKFVVNVDNTKDILIMDDQGKVYRFPVAKIPLCDKNSPGVDIRMIIKKLTSNIINVIHTPDLELLTKGKLKAVVLVLTKDGYIKQLALEDFLAAPPSGIMFIKLDKGDFVREVRITSNISDIVVYSNDHALRMNINEVPFLKRNTKGLRAMDAPEVDGVTILPGSTIHANSDNDGYIVVLTKKGKFNKFNQMGLALSTRAKKGNKVIKLSAGDRIFGVYYVTDNDILVITGSSSTVEIPVQNIQTMSSISTGVKVFSTRGENIVKTTIRRA